MRSVDDLLRELEPVRDEEVARLEERIRAQATEQRGIQVLLDQLEAGQPAPQKGRGGKKAAAAGGGKGGRPAWDAAKVMEVVEGFYGLGHIATARPVLDGEETDSESESESVSDGFPAEGEREEFELPEEDFGHMMT